MPQPPLLPTHPIYWPDKPNPSPPDVVGLPPVVVWVPGFGYITATPGVPERPTPAPTPPPPEATPRRS
jgi:hypothetical protein